MILPHLPLSLQHVSAPVAPARTETWTTSECIICGQDMLDRHELLRHLRRHLLTEWWTVRALGFEHEVTDTTSADALYL